MKRCISAPVEGSTKRPAYERANLVEDLRNEIQKHQDNLRNHLAELFFLQNGGNLLDFKDWCSQSNPYLENYIQQIKCASTDAVGPMLEQVPTGHVIPKTEIKKKDIEHSVTPFMSTITNMEKGESGIMERAKYESLIVQQVALLKQQGMWSLKRLPKVKEPPKIKSHWDYLLEEMQWLSTDFCQERKWKKAAAKKLAFAVAKVFEEKEAAERRKKQEAERKLKKIANGIAKEVMKMWTNVEKVHNFKQESKLEERRKNLMDSHLNFIVGQTEQYSSWLAEGLSKPATEPSSVMMTPSSQDGDVEFKPLPTEDYDDEETIALAEEEEEEDGDEIADLQKQSEMDMDELFETLPSGMLEKMGKEGGSESSSYSGEESSDDDEETIAQEEENNKMSDEKEIGDLEADQNMPLDDLIARYITNRESISNSPSVGSSSSTAHSSSQRTSSQSQSQSEEQCTVSESEESEYEEDADCEESASVKPAQSAEELDQELGELIKEASEAKPSNGTTRSLNVKSKIPFMLRGILREYQHVGLDWLVAMESRKLNGILADEMGLGKTIQTIALLAHLACFRGIWGPHLIIVPTSVLLNWDLEFKKWCPGFKVMSYYGNQKERKEKRVGWTKPNSFHVCVTSYKLVVQDYRIFRSKKWYYMILDEAQNIKNFKSQRWQLLLNFNSQRRLLLTGTPLQNNLMELWSLMHFLMPTVFGSQKAFKEWFSNPLTGMVEGNEEYNLVLITRLHKILRPFLLRRLKKEVELQLPSKTESVIMCGLSKRQRALYEEFLSRSETCDTLSSGRFISVIGVLMQLRKVCNHPDLFEPRPVVSPYALPALQFSSPQCVLNAIRKGPFEAANLHDLNLNLADYELGGLSAHAAHRTQQLRTHRLLIEEVDYKGVIPDNLVYSVSSHSTFPPPRPPSPTLPPLPFLRQMPSLNAAPRTHNTPRTSPHPVMSSPRSSSDSSGLTPPPLSAKQITKSREGGPTGHSSSSSSAPTSHSQLIPAGYFRDPVSGIVLPLVESGMPPPRRPPLGPPQLTKASGPKMPRMQNKRGTTAPPPPTLTPGSCSSPEPLTLRPLPALSPAREIIEHSPNRATWESPSRNSDTAVDQRLSDAGAESTEESDAESKFKPSKDPFYLPSLEEIRQCWKEGRRKMVADINDLRCQKVPMYGTDLVRCVTIKQKEVQHKTVPDRLSDLQQILRRYVMYCPTVTTGTIASHTPTTYQTWFLEQQLSELTEPFYSIKSSLTINLPETRLIQYDCGKLQRLDKLLAGLKKDKHRTLIFTQMTKMLDILEKFLNYHAYTYMRLDGSTKVDKRLEIMERFNADSKIFCMILSTRSGGVGVNLTGADTVIFYDSDWNPTMDAQAQDRCHRIGQTRDVHIYRLVSESTIEENILKKANQKRLLGAVAIEDGNFTTAFFKNDNLSDLFGREVMCGSSGGYLPLSHHASPKHRTIPKRHLESALAEAEDQEDQDAATRAQGELVEEMNDFDEEVPIEGEQPLEENAKNMIKADKEFNKYEAEIMSIEEELTPIERYALRFIENENEENFKELLEQQDEELAAAAPEATLADLQSAKMDEENLNIADMNDVLLTYASWDPQALEELTDVWLPPTPPPQEHDVYYHDPVMQSMYCLETTMGEDELPEVTIIPNLTFQIIPPAVQIKEEPQDPPPPPPQTMSLPPTPAPAPLVKTEQHLPPPPPLEEATPPALVRTVSTPEINMKPTTPFLRKEMNRKHKKRQIKIKHSHDPLLESEEHCQWLPSEEYALHQSVLSIQDIGSSSITDYNWDIISDIINISSNNYKTPKQCRERYSLIVQRDETHNEPRKTHARSNIRVTAEEAGQASTLNFIKTFHEIEKLCAAKANFDYKPLSINTISSNPTHAILTTPEESPVALASKKKDRENKENKEKQNSLLHRRESERKADVQSHNIQHKVQELQVPNVRGPVPVNSMQSPSYQIPSDIRKMPDQPQHVPTRGTTYSVMTSAGVKGHSQQFYLLSAQRPMQGQVNAVNMAAGPGGKPLMTQGKQILVSAGQPPVKMQSQHIGYLPGQVRGQQGGHGGYIPMNNNDELMQQMYIKRQTPHYRAQQPINHPNNIIPLNTVQKMHMSNQGPYMPNQLRGGAPKGVRSMGPMHIQRGVPIQPSHVQMDTANSDGMHHGPRMLPPQVITQLGPPNNSMPPSPAHHQMPPSPQVMQQLKQNSAHSAPTSRTI